MADYMTFQDIYGAVENAIKDTTGTKRTLIKSLINQVYLNELCSCDDLFPLHWLMDLTDNIKTKDAATITGASKASACSITATAHGFATGDIIQIDGVAGMVELNHRTFVVVYSSANAFTLKELNGTDVASSAYTTYTSGGYAYHRGTTLAKYYMGIESFAWHTYSGSLDPIGFTEIEGSAAWMDPGQSGRPSRFLHRIFLDGSTNEYQRLLWFALPDDNYEARIWGPVRPSRMSSDSDVPKLPYQFHDAIVAGVLTRLIESQVQVEAAVVWPQLYKMQVQAIREFNRKWWQANERMAQEKPYLL